VEDTTPKVVICFFPQAPSGQKGPAMFKSQFTVIVALAAILTLPENGHGRIHDNTHLDLVEQLVPAKKYPEMPGGSVSIVEGGEIVFLEAFGVDETANGTPLAVDGVFPMASVSKVFTAYTVLTLIADRLLGLDDLVDPLIPGIDLPAGLKVRHLLSQTSGLGERFGGTASWDAENQTSLRMKIESGLPAFTYPPGEIFRYSNWNSALLGLLIEEVTGEEFTQVVRGRVFVPLGMESSFFSREAHEANARRVTCNIRLATGEFAPVPPIYLLLEPAGGMMSTAEDMGKFIAHLLSPDVRDCLTLALLYTAEWTRPLDSRFSMGMGMMLERHHDDEELSIASHYGGFIGVSTALVLFPEKQAGFFIACNREIGLEYGWRVYSDLRFGLERWPAPESFTRHSVKPGIYRDIRFDELPGVEKLAVLLGLHESLEIGGTTPMHPLSVESRPGDDFITWDLNIFRRVHWYETSTFLIAVALTVFVANVLVFVVSLVRRELPAVAMTGIVMGTFVMFLWAVVATPPMEFMFHYPWQVIVGWLLSLSHLAVGLVVVAHRFVNNSRLTAVLLALLWASYQGMALWLFL